MIFRNNKNEVIYLIRDNQTADFQARRLHFPEFNSYCLPKKPLLDLLAVRGKNCSDRDSIRS